MKMDTNDSNGTGKRKRGNADEEEGSEEEDNNSNEHANKKTRLKEDGTFSPQGGRGFGNRSSEKFTPRRDSNSAAGQTVFIGNLSYETTVESLTEAMLQFGPVKSARIITDRDSGESKGFGYCDFEDSESASKASEMAGQLDIDGRYVNIDIAKERTPGSGGRGDRGGRGGGGFRGGRGDRGFRGGRGDRGGRGFRGGDRGFRGGRGGRGDRGGRGFRGGDRGKSFEGTKTTFD